MGTVIATSISVDLAGIFRCKPISGSIPVQNIYLLIVSGGAWDRTLQPTCISDNKLAYAASGISVVQDLIVLFLPIYHCSKLRMNMRKKLNVILMFSLGALSVILKYTKIRFLTHIRQGLFNEHHPTQVPRRLCK